MIQIINGDCVCFNIRFQFYASLRGELIINTMYVFVTKNLAKRKKKMYEAMKFAECVDWLMDDKTKAKWMFMLGARIGT